MTTTVAARAQRTAPRFIVVQMGARRGYAVPAAFERLGMLEAFYTDLCGTRGVGHVAGSLARLTLHSRSHLTALGARLPSTEVARKTKTFDWIGLQLYAAWHLRGGAFDPVIERYQQKLKRGLGESMICAGFGNATHVYSMLGEGGSFLVEGKNRGLRVISDVYIALSADAIVRAEARAFPDWTNRLPPDHPPSESRPNDIMLRVSDSFVCPSEFVRDDLVSAWGGSPEKTVVVPYIVGERWFDIDNQPQSGRILFAGTADLRKGIHYLAIAADRLMARHRRYRFRVAGHVAPEVECQPVCKSLEFLGRVPRTRIHQEFATADILVLPSLAEGSAGVTYEALGAGVPVVTTKASGSVVRDGIDGLIVPERDPDALASAIEAIIEDRPRRERMAQAARERAREFTTDRFAGRLARALGLLG